MTILSASGTAVRPSDDLLKGVFARDMPSDFEVLKGLRHAEDARAAFDEDLLWLMWFIQSKSFDMLVPTCAEEGSP